MVASLLTESLLSLSINHQHWLSHVSFLDACECLQPSTHLSQTFLQRGSGSPGSDPKCPYYQHS